MISRSTSNQGGDGNVTFTRPFLMLDNFRGVYHKTFDEHVNVSGKYCKGDISYTFTKL